MAETMVTKLGHDPCVLSLITLQPVVSHDTFKVIVDLQLDAGEAAA
jgi:hypothetical protein